MPSWSEILDEINVLLHKEKNDQAFDVIRNKYLKHLCDYTKRDVIVYAADWTGSGLHPELVSINDGDIQGFMQAIYRLKNPNLDLILHTGGGSAEATEAIVSYLRQKFNHIRVFIPQAAMSAGTMLACAGDEIWMGKQSSIGPIDPQFILQTSVGPQAFPAQAILDQFELAQRECIQDPRKLQSWYPMLGQFGPALLVRCRDQIDFGKSVVNNWLKSYMFKDLPDSTLPEQISNYLSDHSNFKTHGKHIDITLARSNGLNVFALEDDQTLQDLILSVFHSVTLSLSQTSAAKLITNNIGGCFVKNAKKMTNNRLIHQVVNIPS